VFVYVTILNTKQQNCTLIIHSGIALADNVHNASE